MSEFLSYWSEWIWGVMAAGIGVCGRYALSHWRTMERRQQAMEQGMQALLRDRILTAYYHYQERGWMTLHGLENVEALYAQYHALGGNGTITKLVADLRKLDVRDD